MRPIATLMLAAALALCCARGDAGADAEYAAAMEREHADDEATSSQAAAVEPAAATRGEAVAYAELEGAPVEGYLARPAAREPVAGVIVIQEWWGLNDSIRAMADRFAGEGYAALAVDLYRGRAATDRDGAAALMRAAMESPDLVEDNLRQAHRYLAEELGLERIGTVGWCFGGGWSLRTGLMLGDAVDAVVVYYGRPVTERAELEKLQAPLLGLFAGEDRGIPVEAVRELEEALAALGKDAAIHVYDGAGHAFANPTGTAYDDDAAADAWEKTRAFFARHLGAA